MKNSIANNLFTFILLITSVFNVANAGTLLEFDNESLIAEISDGQIHGYYGYIHQINPFSCVFLFVSNGGNKNVKKIDGYVTDSDFNSRNRDLDSNGRIFVNEVGNWIIQFEHAPDPGCLNVGDSFSDGPTDSSPMEFTIKKRTKILGLRIVNSKRTFFYVQDKSEFLKQKGFLITSDIVVAFREKGDFSYVRFRNPRTTRFTTGWIKTRDLKNPYSNVRIQ